MARRIINTNGGNYNEKINGNYIERIEGDIIEGKAKSTESQKKAKERIVRGDRIIITNGGNYNEQLEDD